MFQPSINRQKEAAQLVDVGARLKVIANLMQMPMAFRKIKPGTADLALYVMDAFDDQRLIHASMPDSLPKMKLWLQCIRLAKDLGAGFVEWVAKHALEIGGSPIEVLSFLSDIKDWVGACLRASVSPHNVEGSFGNDVLDMLPVARPSVSGPPSQMRTYKLRRERC